MTSVMTLMEVKDRALGRLQHSPLRLAIAQARMSPRPALEDLQTVGAIAEQLHGWRLLGRHVSQETQVLVNQTGIRESARPAETVSVLDSTVHPGLRAAISPTSVAVECDRYTEWPDMREAITGVFTAVAGAVGGDRDRFGVRYVNEIEDERAAGDPQQLAALLAEPLLGAALAVGRPLLMSLQELRFADEHGQLVLRHGLRQPGIYMVDVDYFTDQPGPLDPDALTTLAEEYHRRIENVFAWSLQDTFLEELRGAKEAPK
jgi:uncharacterized protein (TIGR04255 family)